MVRNLNTAATKWIAGLPATFLVCGPANDEHSGKVLKALLKAGNQQCPQLIENFHEVISQLLGKPCLLFTLTHEQ